MKKILPVSILLFPALLFAQGPPPPGLEDPSPAFPIDQLNVPLSITALLLGFYLIYKTNKSNHDFSMPRHTERKRIKN